MNITILGTGHVGGALTRGFLKAGHQVTVAAANPEHAAALAQQTGARSAASNIEAVQDAEIVVLAVPRSALAQVADEIAEVVKGKIVVDVTNNMNADLTSRTSERSKAEELQERLSGTAVIKAFNTVFAARQADPVIDGIALDGFYAGDDETAKETVAGVLEGLGYRPIDAGPLRMARALEEMGLLHIRLNAVNGWPWMTGWKLLGPTK
ncbi:MAG: prephenate dehydrogenase/arogenate dehydrogenase family protein [Coriobacteriia bacterium]|jgi:predicted dinucleotide-binding enzyme|nr:prephenate dehydrogenase/arogenate dehydrogenase family protein [Coriobacteriia bacterium]